MRSPAGCLGFQKCLLIITGLKATNSLPMIPTIMPQKANAICTYVSGFGLFPQCLQLGPASVNWLIMYTEVVDKLLLYRHSKKFPRRSGLVISFLLFFGDGTPVVGVGTEHLKFELPFSTAADSSQYFFQHVYRKSCLSYPVR